MKIQNLADNAAARLLSVSNALDEVAVDRGLVHGSGIRVKAPQIAADLLILAAIPLVLLHVVASEVERRRSPRVVSIGSVMAIGRPVAAAHY